MRILIADKDPYDLAAERSVLESLTTEVLTATDGREVLRLVAEHQPDVVVLASSLGQMGGFAVARDLKMFAEQRGAAPAPRIVVLLERQADGWLARWSRCDGYATKPVPAELLKALVEGRERPGAEAAG